MFLKRLYGKHIAAIVPAFVLFGFRIPTVCLAVTLKFNTVKLMQLSRIANVDGRYSSAPMTSGAKK